VETGDHVWSDVLTSEQEGPSAKQANVGDDSEKFPISTEVSKEHRLFKDVPFPNTSCLSLAISAIYSGDWCGPMAGAQGPPEHKTFRQTSAATEPFTCYGRPM